MVKILVLTCSELYSTFEVLTERARKSNIDATNLSSRRLMKHLYKQNGSEADYGLSTTLTNDSASTALLHHLLRSVLVRQHCSSGIDPHDTIPTFDCRFMAPRYQETCYNALMYALQSSMLSKTAIPFQRHKR
jgi:hypothetical protein